MNTGGVGAAPSPDGVTDVLLPYMPRLVADWAQMTPDERWRPIRGTMVFADRYGFTAMSERLARLGRQGAEEATDAIATCFRALLVPDETTEMVAERDDLFARFNVVRGDG